MVDIYDELGFIKDVLANGLSQKWERDAKLLVRYYKAEGMKKSDIAKKIKQKCLEAAARPDDPICFNEFKSYKRLNDVINKGWNCTDPLRAIKGITIPREVVDWFLHLETDMYLTDEEVDYYKQRRKHIKIKQNNPMNWNRVKYLFTLYIWTKVQEGYVDHPNYHDLRKYAQRFKEDANLPASFSMRHERDYLNDLGFVGVTFQKLTVIPEFMEKYEVFKIPVTEENGVFIASGEAGQGDLYHPGYWIEKQKMGSFVCECCGKEFAYDRIGKNAHKQKYCKECAEKIGHGKTGETKIITCIDCGKEFSVDKHNGKTIRCPKCQKKYKTGQDKLRRLAQKNAQVQDFTD